MAMRASAVALVLLSVFPQPSAPQETITGKTVLLAIGYPPGIPSRQALFVKTTDIQRVHVLVYNSTSGDLPASWFPGITTGMDIKLSGTWLSRGPNSSGDGQQSRRSSSGRGGQSSAAGKAAQRYPYQYNVRSAYCFLGNEMKVSGGHKSKPVIERGKKKRKVKAMAAAAAVASRQPNGSACPATGLPKFNVSQDRRAVFAELNPRGPAVGGTFSQCSYGKSRLTLNSQVVDKVELPCNGPTVTSLQRKQRRVYLIPPSACGFVGLAYIGCDGSFECRAWISSDLWTTPQAYVHELGHHTFLAHASTTRKDGSVDEYGDFTSSMGYCCVDRCPNMPQAWQLGWAPLQQLSGATLRPGTTVQVQLASQSNPSSRPTGPSGVRVVANWTAGVDPIFAGLRSRTGGDLALDPSYSNRINLYSSASTNTYDARPSMWRAGLAVNQSWEAPGANLTIRLRGFASGIALVSVGLRPYSALTLCPPPPPPPPPPPAGKAIVLARNYRRGKPALQSLFIRTKTGKRVHIFFGNETRYPGITTGMDILLDGTWLSRGAGDAQAAAAAHAAAHAAAAGDGLPAAQSAICVWGKKMRVSGRRKTKPIIQRGTVRAAVASGAGDDPVQTVGVLSTNPQLTSTDMSTLFVPIAGRQPDGSACPNAGLPKFNASQVRQAVFAELNPRGATVGGTFSQCSYGKSRLTMKNSLVVDTVELPCNGTTFDVPWTFSKCDFDDFNGWADAVDQKLIASGLDLSKYFHRVYMVPPGPCTFVGLAYIGCDGSFECRAWIAGDVWTTTQAIVHELGHHLYLGHSGLLTTQGNLDEYGDSSSLMGFCEDRCPTTPQMWQLGWGQVVQLDSKSLRPGVTVQVQLVSQSDPSSRLLVWA
ncbi:hypothetical protein CHLNCDRAFT_138258 [Chlorella variabilis]|uniref:Peptidase M11 gametolysin domain-containing protein n=1 Tax=Chlorella variabilis TaxID=554065 RepID=E1ZMM8_CHLVA|nr:hypothetical protein CHLNCDRAFT_138258 [Chlorella variabilis]EFN52721.1 hypothetical protein CHLNCDRAFT_138258 [Chlorella variabilis]|eukprot:XP_005844823.1 hypothetical protein CHLNCDRAFT_138258 [Chlorella variabilis]